MLRRWLGALLGHLVRLWVWTLRVRIEAPSGALLRPSVYSFWHGQQMLLLPVRGRGPLATLVSWSRDGQLQAGVMMALGLTVVRGSSSRGGARGLLHLVSLLRSGHSAAFAVDGPRGPLRVAKPGAVMAAAQGRASLVAVGGAAAPSVTLKQAWDRFEIPLPFARVVIVLLESPNGPGAGQLGALIGQAQQRAQRLLDAGRDTDLPGC